VQLPAGAEQLLGAELTAILTRMLSSIPTTCASTEELLAHPLLAPYVKDYERTDALASCYPDRRREHRGQPRGLPGAQLPAQQPPQAVLVPAPGLPAAVADGQLPAAAVPVAADAQPAAGQQQGAGRRSRLGDLRSLTKALGTAVAERQVEKTKRGPAAQEADASRAQAQVGCAQE
jgi:hypothetical protein